VKIRPPMPFTAGDADLLADEFEAAIEKIPGR